MENVGNKDNVTLIGMPGAGKSTIGVLLAKVLGYGFLDGDLLIQETKGKLLHEIISEEGLDYFKTVEDEVTAGISCGRTVIATGGSVVYGERAMGHLREISTVVYLKLSYDEVKGRLGDLAERGVAMREGQTLLDLYEERVPLYEKYADVIVDLDGLEVVEAMEKIRAAITRHVTQK